MAQTIDARVKQKTGTAADFAGYTLLEGEIALVKNTPTGPVVNFKVGPGNFDSLDWSLQSPGAAQEADTSTVFPAGVPGLYIPTESGTYDGVSVDLSAGYTQLIWDGATLTDAVFPIDLAGYASQAEVDAATNSIDAIENGSIDVYSFFPGDAYMPITPGINIDDVGDYIEWEGRDMKSPGDAALRSLYLFGTPITTRNTIGYYGTNEIRLRDNIDGSPYTIWELPVSVDEFRVYRIEVVASGWELFVDGASMGVKPKSDFFRISTIGNAYLTGTPVVVGLKYLEISSGGVVTTLMNFAQNAESVNVLNTSSIKKYNEFPEGLLSYRTSGVNSQPTFYYHSHLKDDRYIRFVISRELDAGTYSDMFRLVGASLFTYRYGVMAGDGVEMITSGENEFTFLQSGKSDYTGGYHGDEQMVRADFLVNGVSLGDWGNLEDFTLLPCDCFAYLQQSTMHETDNSSHPIIATHNKETTFRNGGYVTKNRVDFEESISIDNLYGGIVCVAVPVTDYAVNEAGEKRTMDHSAGNGETHFMAVTGAHRMRYWSEVNGLGCVCEAYLDDNSRDIDAVVTTKDNNRYGKYYRNLAGITVSSGDFISGRCEAYFFKN